MPGDVRATCSRVAFSVRMRLTKYYIQICKHIASSGYNDVGSLLHVMKFGAAEKRILMRWLRVMRFHVFALKGNEGESDHTAPCRRNGDGEQTHTFVSIRIDD